MDNLKQFAAALLGNPQPVLAFELIGNDINRRIDGLKFTEFRPTSKSRSAYEPIWFQTPPDTTTTSPVMKLQAFDARNKAAPAIS